MPLIRKSTLEFIREARKVKGYSLFDFIHGQVYARWPYLYIGTGVGTTRLAKVIIGMVGAWRKVSGAKASEPRTHRNPAPTALQNGGKITFADTYHGKVMPLELATALVTVNEPVRMPDLEKVIPYGRARDLILQAPDQITLMDCPCRAARENPCLPLEVCMIVGEPFASFVLEHHPERSRKISQEEAVRVLKAEDERGHVHHAFFKDAMLERFFAICNCCGCCCGAMQAHMHGTPMLVSSGYMCVVDEELCLGCGACEEFCQFHALGVEEGLAVVSGEDCMGCGVCVSKCVNEALSLERVVERGEPLEIRELIGVRT
jgi:Pyruvate/2-oxoacid:ferredoxin oxidoreductase delta subunit